MLHRLLNSQQQQACVWCGLGLLNNMPYVIMLAIAKHVSEGGTGVVYIANTCPGLLVKLSSPYWFDRVSYRHRMRAATLCMIGAFVLTALQEGRLVGQLCGVALVSLQIGMGEASLLALAGKYDTENSKSDGSCILCFSTGTGLAGPMGFLWKIALTEWFALSVQQMLMMANLLGLFYWMLFCAALRLGEESARMQHLYAEQLQTDDTEPMGTGDGLVIVPSPPPRNEQLHKIHEEEQEMIQVSSPTGDSPHTNNELVYASESDRLSPTPMLRPQPPPTSAEVLRDLNMSQRFRLVLSLWPYIIPLFSVYAAEYACQAGAWTAIGFPTVHSVTGRAQFYETANWLYQLGSCIARASGGCCTLSLQAFWVLPVLQMANLTGFTVVAAGSSTSWWYQRPLLFTASLYTGLLGGAVYVHGYKRLVADVPPPYTEFALSTTSAAEAVGVLVADVLGLYLQSCLYAWNGITDDGESAAMVSCPWQ